MGIDERISDWRDGLVTIDRTPPPDPDTIDLDGLDDEERQLILDARERKAKRLAQEQAARDRPRTGPI